MFFSTKDRGLGFERSTWPYLFARLDCSTLPQTAADDEQCGAVE